MGGWLRITLIIRLSQPSLAGVGAGAELGNIKKKSFRFQKIIINILALMLWTKVISFNNKNKTNLMRMSCYQSIVLVSTEQRSV